MPHVFITLHGHPYITILEDLQGKSLAVEDGFYLTTLVNNDYPGIEIHTYETTSDAIHAVLEGESDAYAGNRAVATYIMRNEVITNLEVHGKVRVSASINAIGVRTHPAADPAKGTGRYRSPGTTGDPGNLDHGQQGDRAQ